MTRNENKNHPASVRLQNLRERMGYKKPGPFAKMLGVSISIWSGAEKGVPVSRRTAAILCEKIPGLSYDWIYTGDTRYLGDQIRMILGVQVGPKALKGMPLGPHYNSNGNGNHTPPAPKPGGPKPKRKRSQRRPTPTSPESQ